MLIALSSFKVRYNRLSDAKLSGNGRLRFSRFNSVPYFNYVGIFELCIWMLFSKWHSPLLSGIVKIFFLSAKKQMRRIATRTIVALMADEKTWRNLAFSKQIGGAGTGDQFSSNPEHPARWTITLFPWPAFIRFTLFNLNPKPFSKHKVLRGFPSVFSSFKPGLPVGFFGSQHC